MKPIYPDNLSDPMSDENLVLLTLAGDTSAYDRLVLRWETAVVNAALSVCRNRELARDAAQDAFVTAWIKLAHLANGAKYGAWTCKIARNCALQLLTRYRYYTGEISTDDENAAYALEDPYAVDPARSSAKKAERESVHTAIDTLPERVRLIIRLYYLENHSIEEIATLLGVTSGTVKKQLWDGRRKIRKELCAMDETMQDTLLERVHKKVEEVKAWQYLDKKEGFATVYHDALAMIEELPESGERLAKGKYHALADVLMCGWWWLPGEQNDALFARIREAAFAGGNEDVIAEVMARERQGLWESGLWTYIKEKQIPELEKAGYNKALAQTYFWLGTDMCFSFFTGICFNADDEDVKAEGKAALEKAITLSGSARYGKRVGGKIQGRERQSLSHYGEQHRAFPAGRHMAHVASNPERNRTTQLRQHRSGLSVPQYGIRLRPLPHKTRSRRRGNVVQLHRYQTDPRVGQRNGGNALRHV